MAVIRACLALLLGILSLPAHGDAFFEDVGSDPAPRQSADAPYRWLLEVQQRTAYGVGAPASGFNRRQPDLTRVETSLYGRVEGRVNRASWRLAGELSHDWLGELQDATGWGSNPLTATQRSDRRWQWHWGDSHLDWEDGPLWVRGGFQTLAFGEAESLIVTDVLAPRDQRWPFQQPIEEQRLPLPALRLQWASQLDLMVLDQGRTDRLASPFDDGDLLAPFRRQGARVVEQSANASTGYALHWAPRLATLDAYLIAARVNAQQKSLRAVTLGADGRPSLAFRSERLTMAGGGIKRASGHWLLRSEQAIHDGVRLPATRLQAPWVDATEWRSMLAADYNGLSRLLVTLELGSQYLIRHQQPVGVDTWRWSYSAIARGQFWRDRLAVTAQLTGLPGDQGYLTRLNADWQFSDRLSARLGFTTYQANRPSQALYPLRHQDSVTLDLRFAVM